MKLTRQVIGLKGGEIMARPAKSIAMKTGLMTKEEINKRLEGETLLKGQADKITAPSYLTLSQQKIFKYIVRNLEESGILGNLDVYVLSQTAITIDRIQECEKKINEQGLFDLEGKQNPAIKVKESYTKDFFRCCNELSLSPQARAKIANNAVMNKKDGPSLKDILSG